MIRRIKHRLLLWFRLRRPTKSGRKPHKTFFLLILFTGIALGGHFLQRQISPVVEKLALSRITYLAGRVINDAINDQIAAGSIQYDDMVLLDKDNDGRISALKTNMMQINKFKAEITNIVIEKINGIPQSELNIPLGNMFSNTFLSGRGPRIPVFLVSVGSAEANFASVFTSAGINQTRHQIIVNVTVSISALLPGRSASTQVMSEVSVAETVIVGTVPGSYTYLEDSNRSGYELYSALNPE